MVLVHGNKRCGLECIVTMARSAVVMYEIYCAMSFLNDGCSCDLLLCNAATDSQLVLKFSAAS
jgi:hypothetical protein